MVQKNVRVLDLDYEDRDSSTEFRYRDETGRLAEPQGFPWLFISTQEWEELGRPNKITITVEVGGEDGAR